MCARISQQYRKQDSVINFSYEYDVGEGQRANVWELLIISKYPSADSAKFASNNEASWLLTPRTTRLRMKNHVLKFLRENQRIRSDIESWRNQTSDGQGAVFGQISSSGASVIARHPSLGLADFSCSSTSPDAVPDSPHRTSEHDSSADLSSPLARFSIDDPAKYVPVRAAEQQTNILELVGATKCRVTLSQLFNSFAVQNDLSHTAADQFIDDFKKLQPVNDLDLVPTSFKNRLKLPTLKRPKTGISLIGFRDEAGGRLYHFGLFRQIRSLLDRVLEATFGDGPRPKVSIAHVFVFLLTNSTSVLIALFWIPC
jgi:hypothetical protein